MALARPPPSPDPNKVREALRQNYDITETPWCLTGKSELRPGWFGGLVLHVQETRQAFRPITTGYTPANWEHQSRWRRAQLGDLPLVQFLSHD